MSQKEVIAAGAILTLGIGGLFIWNNFDDPFSNPAIPEVIPPLPTPTAPLRPSLKPSPSPEQSPTNSLFSEEARLKSVFMEISRLTDAPNSQLLSGLDRELEEKARGSLARWFAAKGEQQVGPSTFIVDGDRYDLTNPTDLVLAGAVVKSRWANISGLEQKRVLPSIRNLRGKVTIDISKGSPFVEPRELIILNQTIASLEAKGKHFPGRWATYAVTPSYNRDTKVASLNSDNDGGYSVSRGVAAFYSQEYPESLAHYRNLVEAAAQGVKSSGWELKEPELTLAPSEPEMGLDGSWESSYLGAMGGYIRDGVYFRGMISYAEQQGLKAEAAILGAKYRALRDTLGVEFSSRGLAWESIPWKQGDIARVLDHTPEDPGIYLKPKPTTLLDPEWPSIRDGFTVLIKDDPVNVVYRKPGGNNYLRLMYLVRVAEIKRVGGQDFALPGLSNKEGWIPVDFLAPVSTSD